MRRAKRFAIGKTLMPAEFSSAEQIKETGFPPGQRPAGVLAGTQAEDALTMKKAYEAFL